MKVYSRGVVFFYPGFFFYSGKSFAKPATVHRLSSFFFSLRKDTFGAPSALHSKSIRAFLQRASVTLRLHLWFSFHNTRINHPSDGNFGRWASGLCDRFSLFLFFFLVFDYIK